MALVVKIKKRLGDFRLEVAFTAETGVMGLLGASGCGKSVTLRCIAGILEPDEGYIALDDTVFYDSRRGVNLPPQARHVGYLFQKYALFPGMTVVENVAAGVREGTAAERRNRAMGQLERMDLGAVARHYPRQLSGGQQQRTALARILVGSPRLLLLDEPLSALDSYLRWQVELELSDTLADFDGPALFVSHSRDEVFRLCRSICVLDGGKSQLPVPAGELFSAPRTLSACLLSGCKNVSRLGRREGTRVEALDWGVTLELGRPISDTAAYVGVRAHFVRPGQGENAIPCRVERVVEDLFGRVVMVTTPAGERGFSRLRLEQSKSEPPPPPPGEPISVEIAPEDLMLLEQEVRVHETT